MFTFPRCFFVCCTVPHAQFTWVLDGDRKIKPELHNLLNFAKRIPHQNDSRNSHETGPPINEASPHPVIAIIAGEDLSDCLLHPPSGSSRVMLSTRRADDAFPLGWPGCLPPGNQSSGPSTVNIVGGSIIDVVGDYHNHGDVLNFHTSRLSIHNSQSG